VDSTSVGQKASEYNEEYFLKHLLFHSVAFLTTVSTEEVLFSKVAYILILSILLPLSIDHTVVVKSLMNLIAKKPELLKQFSEGDVPRLSALNRC